MKSLVRNLKPRLNFLNCFIIQAEAFSLKFGRFVKALKSFVLQESLQNEYEKKIYKIKQDWKEQVKAGNARSIII